APKSFVPSDRIIYAFSISPREVIQRYEHKTASFDKRIESVIAAQKEGAQVRLCLDPMIFVP
ncbi:MAG TPA: DNA repair photolyase, partial [Clostridiales bacterium]|nr:DNA repair photolyase [Clostridiales bacterium]